MQTLSMASFAAAGRHRLLKASLTPVVLVLLLCQVVAAMPTSGVAGASLSAAGLIAATALGSNSRQILRPEAPTWPRRRYPAS